MTPSLLLACGPSGSAYYLLMAVGLTIPVLAVAGMIAMVYLLFFSSSRDRKPPPGP